MTGLHENSYPYGNPTLRNINKNICQIEHTRHRCFPNFIGNMVSALIAYNFLPKKPTLNLEIVDVKNAKGLIKVYA